MIEYTSDFQPSAITKILKDWIWNIPKYIQKNLPNQTSAKCTMINHMINTSKVKKGTLIKRMLNTYKFISWQMSFNLRTFSDYET